MGVPGFFRYITKNYRTDFVSKEKPSNVDYLFFDFNGLLHPMCFKILAQLDPTLGIVEIQKQMISRGILPYLEQIISTVAPRKIVYIAIDGVAPMAKCNQQRSRRWKSSIDAVEIQKIKEKWGEPAGHRWTNASISPGTEFMNQITRAVTQYIMERKSTWIYDYGFRVIFNPASVPGEGEHKIMEYLRSEGPGSSVIYGLDADLIFLSLGLDRTGVFLLRETKEFNPKNKDTADFTYVNITKFKHTVERTLGIPRWDFIVLCTMIGNDFIPNLPSIDVYDDGLDQIFKIYKEKYESDRLVSESLNTALLTEIIRSLAQCEDQTLKEAWSSKKKKPKKSRDLSDYKLELWHRDNLSGDYEYSDKYKLGSDTPELWKARWYSDHDIDLMCNMYIQGIQWTLQYYKNGNTDWTWFYPYLHAPFCSDLATRIKPCRHPNNKTALKSTWQLFLIMPPAYSFLVPAAYRSLYDEDIKPEIDYSGKRLQWQGKVILPEIPQDFHKKMQDLDKNLPPRSIMKHRVINQTLKPLLF